MSKLEKLKKKEEELEKEVINYKEADDNRGASRKQRELNKVRDLIDLEELGTKREIKKELDICKKFIKQKGMNEEFMSFYIVEIAKD